MVNRITAAPLQPRSVHGNSDPTNGSTHQIASVQASGRLIKLSGLVNKCKAVMVLDSGSTGDFISDAYVRIHKLPCKSYETSSTVWLADGEQNVVSTYTMYVI